MRALGFLVESLKLLIGLRVHLAALLEVLLSVALGLHHPLGLLQDLKLLLGRPYLLLLELLLMHLLVCRHLHLCGTLLTLRLSNLAALLQNLDAALIGTLLVEELWPWGVIALVLVGLHLLRLIVDRV